MNLQLQRYLLLSHAAAAASQIVTEIRSTPFPILFKGAGYWKIGRGDVVDIFDVGDCLTRRKASMEWILLKHRQFERKTRERAGQIEQALACIVLVAKYNQPHRLLGRLKRFPNARALLFQKHHS